MRLSTASTAGLPQDMALPTTMTSAEGMSAGSNPFVMVMPFPSRKVDMGGYTLSSCPETMNPLSRMAAATDYGRTADAEKMDVLEGMNHNSTLLLFTLTHTLSQKKRRKGKFRE